MHDCPDGLCDAECKNLRKIAGGPAELDNAIKWLRKQDYLKEIKIGNWPWNSPKFAIYKIEWKTAIANLKVQRPVPPTPLMPP